VLAEVGDRGFERVDEVEGYVLASWWRNTTISRSFERPERTARRAIDARKRYKIGSMELP